MAEHHDELLLTMAHLLRERLTDHERETMDAAIADFEKAEKARHAHHAPHKPADKGVKK